MNRALENIDLSIIHLKQITTKSMLTQVELIKALRHPIREPNGT